MQSTRFSTACTSFTLVSSSSPTIRAAMVQVALPIQAYRVEPVASSCPEVTIQTATRAPPPRSYVSGPREFSNTFDFCSRVWKRATLFSDLINFERIVKFGKHCSSFDRLRACCMGKHRKVYSGRSETSREWPAPSSLWLLQFQDGPGNN